MQLLVMLQIHLALRIMILGRGSTVILFVEKGSQYEKRLKTTDLWVYTHHNTCGLSIFSQLQCMHNVMQHTDIYSESNTGAMAYR